MHHGAPIWHTERGNVGRRHGRCLLMATPPGLDEDERVAVDDGDDLGGPVACAPGSGDLADRADGRPPDAADAVQGGLLTCWDHIKPAMAQAALTVTRRAARIRETTTTTAASSAAPAAMRVICQPGMPPATCV